ncbi:MAG: hypothetical protein ABF760_01585 [Zymomonas mobilis]|uniref:Uncharacterized protein n=1 Tax=Zymomonas mobilis TaxID=542 RepID=A0A542VZ81_ZYMMB|nr:hypothetical protein [Zymomonas mobilis]TQL16609.1 hypothetical protein FBY58_0145 [Zymomonas mobilis]
MLILNYIKDVMLNDKKPIWVTILFSVITLCVSSYFTYQFAPKLNLKSKIDETRREHFSEITKKLNEEILDLLQKSRHLDEALEKNDYIQAEKNRNECLDSINKLQWVLVDIKAQLRDDLEKSEVNQLGSSLDNLKNTIDLSVKVQNQNDISNAMGDFTVCTKNVLDELYKESSLK